MTLIAKIAIIAGLEIAFSLIFWAIMPKQVNNKKFDIKSVIKGLSLIHI